MDNQQLKARFFGMHIGCNVDVFKSGTIVCRGVVMGVVVANGGIVLDCAPGRRYCDFDFDIKLVLRPLSSITDEEVAHCEGIEKSMLHSKWNQNAIGLAIGDYMRSIGICLPFCGIDPVEAGWAVLSE